MAKKITLVPQYRGGYKDREGKTYTKSEGEALLANKQATLAQWKGKKTAKVSYEGGQYAGGRVSGRKNLVKTETGVINQHKVEFTHEEKRALENAVNAANKRRMRMLKDEKNLPMFVGGKYTGVDVSHRIGPESDFILARKSKSLQRFKTKAEYRNYMKNLEKINSGAYVKERIRLYKRNHMKAIENVFGSDAKDVLMKIRMMPQDEYMKLIQSDEMLEVGYVYDPSEMEGKLNQIRAALGMKLKEEPIPDY